jgi:recombination protein RecA
MGALIDADHGTNQATAARMGIDLERMPFHRTNALEEAFGKIEELIKGGAIEVIALDSIAALLPEGNATCEAVPFHKNESHQHHIEHCLKALLGPLSRSRAVLLITNQVREKIGVIYGNPDTTPWVTLPLRDYASVRVDLRKMAQVKDGEFNVGAEVRAKIIKNRLAAPHAQAQFELRYATGICNEGDLLRLGLEVGVVTKRGNRLSFGEHLLGNGWNEAVRQLGHDATLATRLREGILERRQA